MHPKQLKNKLKNDGVIKSSLGNFGHIIYGSSIVSDKKVTIQLGKLIYPISNTDGCRDFANTDLPADFFNSTDQETPIIMVDRGVCSFVQKVRNIEKVGVQLAIIADTTEEETENLIMTDDGSGNSINIPSFIIRKWDADQIKKTI